MSNQQLWLLRYRSKQQMTEVHIRASSLAVAELVGKAYVESIVGRAPNETYRYIGVSSFVVADESILPPAPPDTPPDTPPKDQKNPTMKDRLTAAFSEK